jgi:hypothetical protein
METVMEEALQEEMFEEIIVMEEALQEDMFEEIVLYIYACV